MSSGFDPQRNIRELQIARNRGTRLNLQAPIDLRLNKYGVHDIQQLIANLVNLSFALGMNTQDNPLFELPSEVYERITGLNNFLYGTIQGRHYRDGSNEIHMGTIPRQLQNFTQQDIEQMTPAQQRNLPATSGDFEGMTLEDVQEGCSGGARRRKSQARRKR